jgi:hypothetical protein
VRARARQRSTSGARLDRKPSWGGMVEMRGLEPLTPAMRTRCSSN